MKKMFFTFLLLTQYLIGFSLFSDDFSDGNFTYTSNNIGHLGVFEVDTSYKLHLIDSVSNTTYLTTTSHAVINGSWQFDIKMDFSPSTSNYSKVYLISNSQNDKFNVLLDKVCDEMDLDLVSLNKHKNPDLNMENTMGKSAIIWEGVFSENGNIERFKKVVVLSR